MKPRIKFICTGMCGEEHPVHKHCKECSHASFEQKLGTLTVIYNAWQGASFWGPNGIYWPAPKSYLWKVADEVVEFAERNFKRWRKK